MINLFYDEIDLIDSDVPVSEYRNMVKHPGKFESESAYVPYMWDNILSWGDVPDNDMTLDLWQNGFGITDSMMEDFDSLEIPDVYGYDVDLIDYVLFPELLEESIVKVYLYEDEQGFVNVYDVETISLESIKELRQYAKDKGVKLTVNHYPNNTKRYLITGKGKIFYTFDLDAVREIIDEDFS